MGIDQDGFLSEDLTVYIGKLLMKHKDLFDLASDVNRFSQETMLSLNVHSKNAQELLVATILIRCLSHYQASIILCQRGMIPDARIIARALIEAMFILVAISKDYRLAVEYAYEDEFQRLKAIQKYREMHKAPPPGWTEGQMAAFEAQVKKIIGDKSLKKRTTENWAKEADMHSWYLSPYFDLSESVHVKSRDVSVHIITNSENEPKEFKWAPSQEGMRLVLGTVIEAMCVIIKHAGSVFKIEVSENVDRFTRSLRSIDMNDSSGNNEIASNNRLHWIADKPGSQ
jgi:hypothetical protein